MNTGAIKFISMFGIGYMFKSLIVTFGQTSENLTVNLILLFGCVASFAISVYAENEQKIHK